MTGRIGRRETLTENTQRDEQKQEHLLPRLGVKVEQVLVEGKKRGVSNGLGRSMF